MNQLFFAGYHKCFLVNQDLESSKDIITTYANVESHIVCQIHCKDESLCQSFVYSVNLKECFLKSKKVDEANISPKKGILSGPKYCQSKTSQGNVKKYTLNYFSFSICYI